MLLPHWQSNTRNSSCLLLYDAQLLPLHFLGEIYLYSHGNFSFNCQADFHICTCVVVLLWLKTLLKMLQLLVLLIFFKQQLLSFVHLLWFATQFRKTEYGFEKLSRMHYCLGKAVLINNKCETSPVNHKPERLCDVTYHHTHHIISN